MSSEKNNKSDYSRKILKILGEKRAVSLPEIKEKIGSSYALNRSIKGMKDSGLIEQISNFARLTEEGKKKFRSLELENPCLPANISWDGLWRIVLLDLPEDRKSE